MDRHAQQTETEAKLTEGESWDGEVMGDGVPVPSWHGSAGLDTSRARARVVSPGPGRQRYRVMWRCGLSKLKT